MLSLLLPKQILPKRGFLPTPARKKEYKQLKTNQLLTQEVNLVNLASGFIMAKMKFSRLIYYVC